MKRWLLIGIVVWMTSLGVRSWFAASTMPFSQDQARDVLLIDQYREEKRLLVDLGPKASVGEFYLPPLFYQIHLWLSYLTNNHPLTMLLYSVVIESMTPLLVGMIVYQLTKHTEVTIGVMLCYALSPFIISWASNSWNPATLPFFTALFIWSGMRYIAHRSRWAVVVHVVSMIILINLHFQTLTLFPLTLGLLLVALVRRDGKTILVSLLLGMGMLGSYFGGEMHRGWQNTSQIVQYLLMGQPDQEGWHPESFLLSTVPHLFDEILWPNHTPLTLLGYGVGLGGIVSLLWMGLQRRTGYDGWIVCCLVTSVFLLSFYRGYILDYYLSILFVWPPILMGVLLSRLPIRMMVLIPFVALYVGAVNYLLHLPLHNQYKSYEQIVQTVKSLVETTEVHLWIGNHEDKPSIEYFMARYHLQPVWEESAYIAIVCGREVFCNLTTWLTNNQVTEESWESLEERNPYTLVSHVETLNHQVVIGKQIPPNH